MGGCGVQLRFSLLLLQDSRSEHERQYLLCQGCSSAENTELVKSPRWDWHSGPLGSLGERHGRLGLSGCWQ